MALSRPAERQSSTRSRDLEDHLLVPPVGEDEPQNRHRAGRLRASPGGVGRRTRHDRQRDHPQAAGGVGQLGDQCELQAAVDHDAARSADHPVVGGPAADLERSRIRRAGRAASPRSTPGRPEGVDQRLCTPPPGLTGGCEQPVGIGQVHDPGPGQRSWIDLVLKRRRGPAGGRTPPPPPERVGPPEMLLGPTTTHGRSLRPRWQSSPTCGTAADRPGHPAIDLLVRLTYRSPLGQPGRPVGCGRQRLPHGQFHGPRETELVQPDRSLLP